jgi:hypothetical protein
MAEMPDWERRVGLREINRRRVNEAIERGRQTGAAATFVCECGRTDCNTTLTVPLDEYESVRTDFERFLLVPGHELPPVDSVLERRRGYVVIAKEGEAAQMAKDTDPRADEHD